MVSNNYSIRNAVFTHDTQFQSWRTPKRGGVSKSVTWCMKDNVLSVGLMKAT